MLVLSQSFQSKRCSSYRATRRQEILLHPKGKGQGTITKGQAMGGLGAYNTTIPTTSK